jgi:hypothetical protein
MLMMCDASRFERDKAALVSRLAAESALVHRIRPLSHLRLTPSMNKYAPLFTRKGVIVFEVYMCTQLYYY